METMQISNQIKPEEIKLPDGNNVADFLAAKARERMTDEFVFSQLGTNGALIKSIKKLLRPSSPAALVGSYIQFAADDYSRSVLLWPGSSRYSHK